jgi:amino acid transporter
VVGLFGYASVAALYAVFDFLAGRGTLYTVDLLGKSVFKGLRDTGILGVPIDLDLSVIALYNGLHLLISVLIGLIVVVLVAQSERRPSLSRLVLTIIVAGFVITVLAVGFMTQPIRPLLPWWSIVAANALAVAVAGSYLLRKRPGVWRRLITG